MIGYGTEQQLNISIRSMRIASLAEPLKCSVLHYTLVSHSGEVKVKEDAGKVEAQCRSDEAGIDAHGQLSPLHATEAVS